MKLLKIVFFGTFLFSTNIVYSNEYKIDVFTTQDNPAIEGCEVDNNCHIYFVDTMEKYLDSLSSELSSDPEEAEKQALSIMEEKSESEWVDTMNNLKLFDGLLLAWQMKVVKHPAIVIDDQYVSYGSVNVNQVIDDYEIYVKKEGQQ